VECAAHAGPGLEPDASAVTFDDLLAHRQPDASAGVLRLGVQPLEDDEDAVQVLGLDANAIVAHREHPLVLCGVGGDVDTRPGLA
jgi:hypothetical protein